MSISLIRSTFPRATYRRIMCHAPCFLWRFCRNFTSITNTLWLKATTCKSRLIASAWSQLSLPLPPLPRDLFSLLRSYLYHICGHIVSYLCSYLYRMSLFVSPFSAILLFLSFAICLTNEPSSSPTRDQGDQDDCDRNHQRQ